MNLILFWADNPADPAIAGLTIGQVAAYGIAIVLVLLAITTFLAVIGPLIYSLLNISDSWQGIAAIAGIGILAFIAYSISGGDLLAEYGLTKGVGQTESKIIDSVLTLFFILFIPAVALLLFSIIRDVAVGFFK